MLFCGNNLNDIECISKASCNLLLKSVIHLSSNDVVLTGGSIEINTFYFNTIPVNNNLLKCDANNKVISKNQNFPLWVKYNMNEVSSSIFMNDIDATFFYEFSTSNLIFNSDYTFLSGTPNVIDAFDLYNTYISEYDFYNDYSLDFDFIFNTLHYSHCNLSDDMAFTNVLLEKLNIKLSFFNEISLISYDTESSLIGRNAIIDIPVGNVYENGFVNLLSLNVYDKSNLQETKSSEYVSVVYNILMDQYLKKNESYLESVSVIVSTLEDERNTYITSSEFFNMNNLDIGLSNLQIYKLGNNIVIRDESLELHDLYYEFDDHHTLRCSNIINFENILEYGFIAKNSDDNLTLFDQTSYNNLVDGLFIIEIMTSIDNEYPSYNTCSIPYFLDSYESNKTLLTSLHDDLVDTVFTNVTSATTNLLRTRTNLAEIKDNNSMYIETAYSVLDLHEVAHKADFDVLKDKPMNLSSFANDKLYIYKNIQFNNEEACRLMLNIHSLGLQNIDDVNMHGTMLNLDFLSIHNNLSFASNENNYEKFLQSDSDGESVWISIPEYNLFNSNTYGIVFMYDNDRFSHLNNYDLYETAENEINSTYTTRLLYDMYYSFESQIENVQRTVNDLRSMFDISKSTTSSYTTNILNLYVIDFDINAVFLPSSYNFLNNFIVKLNHLDVRKHFNLLDSTISIDVISKMNCFKSNPIMNSLLGNTLYFEFDLPDDHIEDDNIEHIKINMILRFSLNSVEYQKIVSFKFRLGYLLLQEEVLTDEDAIIIIPINKYDARDKAIIYSLMYSLIDINAIKDTIDKPYVLNVFEPFNFEKYIFSLKFNIVFSIYYDVIICKFDFDDSLYLVNVTDIHLSLYLFNDSHEDGVLLYEAININNNRSIYTNLSKELHPNIDALFTHSTISYVQMKISFTLNENKFIEQHYVEKYKYFSIENDVLHKMLKVKEISDFNPSFSSTKIIYPSFFSDLINSLIINDSLNNAMLLTEPKVEYYYHSVIYNKFNSDYIAINIPVVGFEFEILNFTVNNYYIYVEILYNVRNQNIFNKTLELIIYISNDIELFELKTFTNLLGTNTISCILVNNYSNEHNRIFTIGATKTLVFKTNYFI